MQDEAVAACRVFLEFLRGNDFRTVVRDRSRGDEHIAGDRGFARGEHVAGADYVDARDAIRGRQVHWAADQGDSGAGFYRGFGQGEAHFAGAVVGDVAHRVDVFLGRAGGNHHVFAGQRLTLEAVRRELREVGGFEHAPQANVAAGLAPGGRTEDFQVAAFKGLQVGLGGRVAPHGLVHGWGDGDHRIGGQHQCGQQIIGNALGQTRDQVRSGRGDQYQIGPFGQFDVAHGGFGRRVQQVQVHRVPGQCLHGQRGDELGTATGHDHAHFGALVHQAANQVGALVGSDAAADAQNNAFPIQPLHRPAFQFVGDIRGETPSPG
ncbi:hypothetical protein D3C86_986000 [compost metagenome]